MSERLNEWAVFSEKNKELCEWLTQMESKVSQNGDILIEEMIEKLKKVQDAWLHMFSLFVTLRHTFNRYKKMVLLIMKLLSCERSTIF